MDEQLITCRNSRPFAKYCPKTLVNQFEGKHHFKFYTFFAGIRLHSVAPSSYVATEQKNEVLYRRFLYAVPLSALSLSGGSAVLPIMHAIFGFPRPDQWFLPFHARFTLSFHSYNLNQ